MIHKLRTAFVVGFASIILLLSLTLPTVVSADTLVQSGAPSCSSSTIGNYLEEGVDLATGSSGCGGQNGNLTDGLSILAREVVNIFSVIVGIVAVIMIIYGGFRYITSGGDSNRVGGAKNTLIYAIIGLVIVALAQLIVHYVLSTASGIAGGGISP